AGVRVRPGARLLRACDRPRRRRRRLLHLRRRRPHPRGRPRARRRGRRGVRSRPRAPHPLSRNRMTGLGVDAYQITTLIAHAAAREALATLRGFAGDIDALPEGTLAFAGPGLRTDGKPLRVDGVHLNLYTPLLQVRTDLVRAKLIETPWLCRLNHGSMVASK